MTQLLSKKEFYDDPLKSGVPVSDDMVKEAYLVFACRHKFCRDICPVFDQTRDEAHTSYGFHTAILAVAKGIDSLSSLADAFTYCLECGACELRCPNTMYGGDFYKRTTTTVDLVRKMRRDQLADGTAYAGSGAVQEYLEEHRGYVPAQSELVTKWVGDVKVPGDMKTALFVDYFTATQGTEVPRLAAKIMNKLGVRFGVYATPGVTAPELLSQNLEEWKSYAEANVEAFRELGVTTLVVMNPHEYSLFVRDYPKYFDLSGIDVVFVTEYLAKKMAEKGVTPSEPVAGTVTYHDPCTINKLCGEHESPRDLLDQVPGMEFVDVDAASQWKYCCGNGNGAFKKMHPDIASAVGRKRLREAADLGATTLAVACPHCKDQLTEIKTKSGIQVEPVHVLEILAQSLGVE
jgi:heterodisulfide reductase subunit D